MGDRRVRIPSSALKTFVGTRPCGLADQAARSEAATRTSPQAVFSHSAPLSSATIAWMRLHGKPFVVVSVAMRRFQNLLSPPSVATQSAPSPSRWRSITAPPVKPSAVVYQRVAPPGL